jgi:GR25 family glycosyltransferase involved in LPS biosynthesis
LTLKGVLFSDSVDLTPFLKRVDEAVQPCGFPGVDCIYVINLKERENRWKRMKNLLRDFNLKPTRFDAVNGWKASGNKALKKCTLFGPLSREYPEAWLTWGGVGCFLSHLSILKDAHEKKFERIWILEDDIEIFEDLKTVSSSLDFLDHFDPEWDVFYTDPNNIDQFGNYRTVSNPLGPPKPLIRKDDAYYNQKKIVNEDIMRIYYRGGTYSMLISRRGIEKIYRTLIFLPIIIPLDEMIHFIDGIREYAFRRPVVSYLYNGGYGSNTSCEEFFGK